MKTSTTEDFSVDDDGEIVNWPKFLSQATNVGPRL